MQKRQLRLAIAVITLLAVYLVLLWWQFKRTEGSGTALIVFKLPRSGSSWFTEILNSDTGIYISKEMIQSADVMTFSLQDRASHINQALMLPTDKLARKHALLPSGRFVEDYVSSLKLFNKLNILGLTLNPEHVQGMVWDTALSGITNARIVIYVRSNLVKTAISAIRGSALKQTCGLSNMKVDRPDCTLPAQTSVSLPQLLDETLRWEQRYQDFYQAIEKEAALSKLPIHTVYYEQLQDDLPSTMQTLRKFLHPSDANMHISGAEPRGTEHGWVKRTPEDLALAIANFADLSAQLTLPQCTLVHAMLHDKEFTIFDWRGRQADSIRACYDALFPAAAK